MNSLHSSEVSNNVTWDVKDVTKDVNVSLYNLLANYKFLFLAPKTETRFHILFLKVFFGFLFWSIYYNRLKWQHNQKLSIQGRHSDGQLGTLLAFSRLSISPEGSSLHSISFQLFIIVKKSFCLHPINSVLLPDCLSEKRVKKMWHWKCYTVEYATRTSTLSRTNGALPPIH